MQAGRPLAGLASGKALKDQSRARPEGTGSRGQREAELATACQRGWTALSSVLGHGGWRPDGGCPEGEDGWQRGSRRHAAPSAQTHVPPPPGHPWAVDGAWNFVFTGRKTSLTPQTPQMVDKQVLAIRGL